MKKILLYLTLLIITNNVFSQYKIDNLSFEYGEEIIDEKGKIVKIVGEANGFIYALGNKKDDFYLKLFTSNDMKMKSNNKINLPEFQDKDIDFEEVFLLDGKLYIIGSVYQRKEKIFKLVAFKVSDNGTVNDKFIPLFESGVEKKSERGNFYFKTSTDDTKLLVMHASLFKKEDAVKYDIKLFDSNCEKLFGNSEKVLFDDKKKDFEFVISDFEVTDNNDTFLVINESYRDSKKKEQIEKFQVFAFKQANGFKKEIIDIKIKDKEIINCSMLATKNGKVQLVGFYSSVRESGRANRELKGIYNATIDVATSINDNLKFNEFDYATKVKLIGERKAKKGKDLKPNYKIHTIIEKNDGGLIVLSEERFLTIYTQSAAMGLVSIQTFTHTTNEIIVSSLKSDGSLEWSNVVAKEQSASYTQPRLNLFIGGFGNGFSVAAGISFGLGVMGKGPEYLSIIPIYKDGQLSVLFNDNKKNKGITDIEKIKELGNYNNAVPTLFEFDEKGKLTRKDPEEIIKKELVMRPGVYFRKSSNEYIIYSSRKESDKIGRMTL